MLELHFINVADGDAILAEDWDDGEVFRMLVDTGRAWMEESAGSMRLTAADYLRERGISHIHVLVVTHLHTDHFGGLERLLSEITIDRVYSGYVPSDPLRRVPPEPEGQKTVRGLIECLNQWARDVELLNAAGSLLHPVPSTIPGLRLTRRLRADVICPNETVHAAQCLIWEAMFAGREVPEGWKYWASKSRNPGSLRLRLSYAGRSVELAGDCYGQVWDNDSVRPCDILKVPHHGDGKALTQTLAERLRPTHAVISCGQEYLPRKDRPSFDTVELLRRQGTEVWFTDSFAAQWHVPNRWRCVDFTIRDDGTILAPEHGGSGRR